ncbi:hypothetical protein, partial [Bombella apis]|uniref:hypothetical protein n=1 Tax=Bombella apis TaxID=1785988 RepID=UPI0024A88E08
QAAGISLDKTDRGQLLAAIRKFVNASLPVNNPAVQGTLTVNRVVSTDNGGDDLNLLYGPGLASRFSFQRDGNTVLYKGGVAFFSLNEGGAFLGGNRVITTADLAVETARAMAAEAAALPASNPAVQGTLTAGIFAAPGNGSQNLNVLYGPGLSYRLAGQNDGNLVAYVNNSPFLSISPKGMTFNGNTMATAGDLAALAALAARMQPMGNYVTAGNRGPTKTYNFDVVAAHGDWISFPDPFSGDAVAVVPAPRTPAITRFTRRHGSERIAADFSSAVTCGLDLPGRMNTTVFL